MHTQEGLIRIRDFNVFVKHQINSNAADTIVFLHDSLGCTALWRDFPEYLANMLGCNYLVYDRRGYGLSDSMETTIRQVNYMHTEADVLIEVLQACKIEQAILFGHSDGGTIALIAASVYPEYIKAIITEGAHVFVEEITLDGIANTQLQYETTNLKERLQKYHGNNTEQLFEAWVNIWLSDKFKSWDITSVLTNIECPTLIIQGTEDEFGTYAQVEAIAEGVKGATEICMVANAGHSPHKQNEIWLAGKCYSFLEKHL